MKGVQFSNGRYTKGVPFLPKMVYKRVRGRTSGRSLPVLNFFGTTPPPPHPRHIEEIFLSSIVVIVFNKMCAIRIHYLPIYLLVLQGPRKKAFAIPINWIKLTAMLISFKYAVFRKESNLFEAVN